MVEFNPRVLSVAAGDLFTLIVGGKHGVFPDAAVRIRALTNDELIGFRLEDPIRATQATNGLSLTGGHHRVNEVVHRVEAGLLDAATVVRVLVLD